MNDDVGYVYVWDELEESRGPGYRFCTSLSQQKTCRNYLPNLLFWLLCRLKPQYRNDTLA